MPLNVVDLLNDPAAWQGTVPLSETHLPRREVTRRFLATLAVYTLLLGLPVSIAVAAVLAPHSRETASVILIAIELAFIAYAVHSERASPTTPWRENTWLDLDRRCWVRHRDYESNKRPPEHEEIAFDEATIYCRTIHFETGVGYEAGLIRRCHLNRFQDIATYGNFHCLIYDDNQEALESIAERVAARLAMPCIKERDIFGRLLERWKSERAISRPLRH